MWCGKLRGVCSTSKVSVLQILIHLWLNIQYSLIHIVVLPDNEASFLTNSNEVDITFSSVGVHNDLVDTFISEDYSATFADEAGVYVEHNEAVLFWDTASDEEMSTCAECHRLDAVAEESDLVHQLV